MATMSHRASTFVPDHQRRYQQGCPQVGVKKRGAILRLILHASASPRQILTAAYCYFVSRSTTFFAPLVVALPGFDFLSWLTPFAWRFNPFRLCFTG